MQSSNKPASTTVSVNVTVSRNKVEYTATLVACRWTGAVLEVTRASGQEPFAQKAQKRRKRKDTDGLTNNSGV